MSLSKGIHLRRCSSCIKSPLRREHSGSSNTVNRHHHLLKTNMQSKMLSMTQWKLLNHLKDYLMKMSNDKKLKAMLNKEVVAMLQKLQPDVYSSQRIRFVETTSVTQPVQKKPANAVAKVEEKDIVKGAMTTTLPVITSESPVATSGSSYASFPSTVLNGLMKRKEIEKVVPKWKNAMHGVSKSAVLSRTHNVILSIAAAETNEVKQRSVQELIEHIKMFPEVKSHVVKEGVVRLLLRVENKTKDSNVHAVINEAFALLGHSRPLPGKGIRILTIDGGGIRGLLVIEMLRKLEELTGKKIHQLFDYVCGVSTGAIIACSIGGYQKDLDTIARTYRDISVKVFNQSAIWGTGNLVWSHSYYDTPLWEKMLKEYLGEEDLLTTARNPGCPKLSAISAIVNQSRVSAYIFRNYSLPWRVQSQYVGGYEHKVWEAVRASAAAPTYFEECKLGNFLHQDGGILVNNPTAVAIHEAKLLWPNHSIQCVVSFGTGRTVPCHPESTEEPSTSNSSWKTKFLRILDSATDTEAVHTMLNDLLPDNVYFRFNPYLTEMLNMAEIDPKKLEQLQRDAVMYLRRNEDKFQEAAKVLCESKSPAQKAVDWINHKRDLVGLV